MEEGNDEDDAKRASYFCLKLLDMANAKPFDLLELLHLSD